MEESSDRDQRTASEEEELHDSADSDESSSEEGSVNAGALLDLEASESGGEDEDDDEDDDDDVDVEYGGMSIDTRDNHQYSFPQFCRLPIELRQRVWEFFDQDLRAPARVFEAHFVGGCLWPSGTLEQQTDSARALLEVHRESRQMGLKFYPDKLPMLNRRGSLRYNKDRDIIFLGWMSESMDWDSAHWGSIADDLKEVKNLAFEVKPDLHLLEVFGNLPFHTFASLQRVYPCWDAYELHTRNLKWCVSDSVHVFNVKTEEQEPGLGEDIEMLYCWPNLESHFEYAEKEIPKDLRLGCSTNKADKSSIELWPMVLFSAHEGVQRYHRLREKALADPDAAWDSESSSESEDDSEEEENEYESEGIDDATIDGSDNSDEGDDLAVHGSSDDEAEGGLGFDGFSHQGDAMGFSADAEPVGQFSSLEPESPKHGISDDSDSDDEPARPVKRQRRQVVSSDSEGDPADEPAEKVKEKSRPPNRRAGRVVLSDSDDSDEDGDDGVKTKGNNSESEKDDATADKDSAEDSDSESDEDEEEEVVKKPMSLAERLRLYRSENPIPEDGADSNSDDAGSEPFYQDQDDDGLVEGGSYGDDDEVSENDLIMDMTEEGLDGDDDDGW